MSNFKNEGFDMKQYIDAEFKDILDTNTKKTKANLPFSNRFELVRMDQFHRRNIKIKKQIKNEARAINRDQIQMTNII